MVELANDSEEFIMITLSSLETRKKHVRYRQALIREK